MAEADAQMYFLFLLTVFVVFGVGVILVSDTLFEKVLFVVLTVLVFLTLLPV